MSSFYVDIGDSVSFSKTVGESDVYLFAGITGDLAPNHVDEEYMKRSSYGSRIAHGALLIGYMSTASSMAIADSRASDDETPVSLGYDRIRFLAPVFLGDTITVHYEIVSVLTKSEDGPYRTSVSYKSVWDNLVAVGSAYPQMGGKRDSRRKGYHESESGAKQIEETAVLNLGQVLEGRGVGLFSQSCSTLIAADYRYFWHDYGHHQFVNYDALITTPRFDKLIRHPRIMPAIEELDGRASLLRRDRTALHGPL